MIGPKLESCLLLTGLIAETSIVNHASSYAEFCTVLYYLQALDGSGVCGVFLSYMMFSSLSLIKLIQ